MTMIPRRSHFRPARLAALATMAIGTTLAGAAEAPAQQPRCETWRTGYQGRDAQGPHVLGYWQFRPDAVTADSSSQGHTLTLAGAEAASEGKFDGGLESFAGWPVTDTRHAAYVASQPGLSPGGPFTVEMWLRPKPELTDALQPVLLDKKYVADTDYQLRLTAADRSGTRRMQLALGFGESSETFFSDPFPLGSDWQHLAFTYDGAGQVRFFRNGVPIGADRKPGRGPVAPGRHVLSIGDRVGSYYAGFPGYLDEVRICRGVLEFRPLALEFHVERKTLRRMEPSPSIPLTVRNLTDQPVEPGMLRLSLSGHGGREVSIPRLEAGGVHAVDYSFDTSLRPDTYRLQARLLAKPAASDGEDASDGEAARILSEHSVQITTAPRPLRRMPVMMWGIGSADGVRRELDRLQELGFTHCLGGAADYGTIWAAGKPVPPASPERIAATREMLDLALAHDFGIAFALSPGGWLKSRPELQRVDRDGRPYADRPDVNAALPRLPEFCFNVGASVARTYDAYPAWQAVLVNTEVRDSSQLSFSPFDREAYRKFSGAEIPDEVTIKNGVQWNKLPDFPASRVIADDHPVLEYYRWFWTVGDGWNRLHSAVHRGVHSTGREDVWTWFDPAIRAPSIFGSGGEADVLGQWTYTNPDPLRVGYFSDQLLTMAGGGPKPRRAMKMTQLFWYRSQTAPPTKDTERAGSPFEDYDPDAAYITIAPMHLRESFWTKLARPLSGLMYHGWQALVPTDSPSGYRYTHPDTQVEFARLHREILPKLGPTLLQVDDWPSDVAFLESFTAQMFARRGSYGYSRDEAYLTLRHAQIQPRIVFEETVIERGLDDFRVVVLADCDVLPASVARRIAAFRQRGGIVVGDEHLAPGVQADVVLPSVVRTNRAAEDHARLLAAAADLREALDGGYARRLDSDNPRVVTRCRQAGESDYVFVVNDHREYGAYVGRHGRVMENGLPSSARISLGRTAGHVYDLVAGREVPAAAADGRLHWSVDLGPCAGNVFLVAPAAIDSVTIAAGDRVPPGGSLEAKITVANPSDRPVPAVIPLRVEILDPAGRAAEFSGFHAARGGRLTLRIEIASNDMPGVWQIGVQELASRQTATHSFRVGDPPGHESP